MRKEEVVEPAAALSIPMAEEAELSDEELLGEATLAKLSSRTILIKAEDEEVEFPVEEEAEEWEDTLDLDLEEEELEMDEIEEDEEE